MQFLLAHSPFLGPSVWLPLKGLMAAKGHLVSAPDLRSGLDGGDDQYGMIARLIAAVAAPDNIVVLHSGAGALAPSIWSANHALNKAIFLDGLLPYPGRSWLQTLPPEMEEKLLSSAHNGRLPPWPTWLPTELLRQLIPESNLRGLIASEAPTVPVSYASEKAPLVSEWSASRRCAYIQMSSAYDAEANAAAAEGFPVSRLSSGNHLSMITNPLAVASLIVDAAKHCG